MLKRIYLAGFFLAWNTAITAYANSTFLEKIVGVDNVGIVYATSALVTLFGIGLVPSIINRIGNKKTFLFISLFSISSLALLILVPDNTVKVVCFMIYLMCNILLYFTIDIFIEHFSQDANTGKIRGAYLSLINGAWIISPFLASLIIQKYTFGGLYLFALTCLSILTIVIYVGIKDYHDKKYERRSLVTTLRSLYKNKPVLRVTAINFILQCFFAVMVVYSVIYMQDFHNLTWKSIGPILTVMLIPFVALSYPIGRLIDKKIVTEKTIIGLGLFLMSISVFLFVRVPQGNVLLLGLCLLLSRIGAASVESAGEMFFFKHIDDSETGFLSLFRDMTPLAYAIIPILASLLLDYYSMTILFTTLSLFILIGYICVPFLNYETKN